MPMGQWYLWYRLDISRYHMTLYRTQYTKFEGKKFGQTRISRKTPISRPNGRTMCVFCELLGENRPRYIESALYKQLVSGLNR